jgi:PKD repeat protein
MAVSDVFKVYLYADPFLALYDVNLDEAEEITSGIMNVDIVEGTDTYEGPQEQIDTGQFTIVSRNPNLDPKINPNLKYNSAIKFYDERFGEFFRGYVTDINVEYQRNDNPIITITGTDIFGVMQRVVVSQESHDAIMALSTGPTWNGITFTEFLPYMYDFTSKYLDLTAISQGFDPQCEGFFFPTSPGSVGSFGQQAVENLNYSPAKYIPQVGETYLDVINKYAQTNLTSFSARGPDTQLGFFYINVYPFAKYDPTFWFPQQDPYLQYADYDFNSDPNSNKPYETILIDNGYNRVINQIDISNEYRFVDAGELKSESENFTRTSSDSIEDYAISRASMSTIYPEDGDLPNADWADRYSENIFQITGFPGQEIQKITFDNARIEDIENEYPYSRYLINQLVRIKHQINNNETIDRIHNIAGITHNISLNKWEMGFTLKPSKEDNVFTNQGSLPILTMNATSGDANFNFTATIGSVDPERIESIVWALSATDPDDPTLIYPYALSGNMFKNGLARTGYTQTWNFDDDGILAPYSFDSESTYEEPTDNRYGGYGPGNWNVYAFITLTNGFTILLQQTLVVGTPVVEANFGWTQNLTTSFGQVTFVDTSVNHETGEPDSYAWNFGDGTTSALRNPTKVYNPAPGTTTYSVSLTVFAYGVGGAKVYNTHTETVTLVQPTMVPDFTFTQDNQTVTFTNTSTNVGLEEPDAYLWEFGDGTTSQLKNPIHVFPVDATLTFTYSVKLTTRNIWEQVATITKTVTVTGLNQSGTLPGNKIKLKIDNYIQEKDAVLSTFNNMYPYFFDFKARTSGTLANLAYLKPTTRTNTNNITWYEADGTTVESGDLLNLTRDSSITPTDQFGLTPYLSVPAGSGTVTANFELITTLTEPIALVKDMLLTFRDVGTFNNISYPSSSSSKNTISVDMPDSFGGWVNVGYFPLTGSGRVVDNTIPAGAVTQAVKTFVPLRPMPMNIPYFKYTFDNRTATFTSMETGVSYAWNFGDGTTSTLKDPVKTFSSKNTYTVTLTVTFADSTTRTTTEPVIVEAMNPFDVRYVKFVQNYHDGTHAFDTPYISNFAPLKRNIEQFAQPFGTGTPLNVAKAETYSMNYVQGTDAVASIINPIVSPQNAFVNFRAQSLDATHRSEWEIVRDYKAPIKNITDYVANLYIPTQYGQAPTVAAGINYSVYVTNYTGEPANIGTATWTKVSDIVPTGLSATVPANYLAVPS